MAVENRLFAYHFVWWNIANFVFHALAGLALYSLLTAIRPSRAAAPLALLFVVLVVLNPIPPLMGWGSRFLVTVASPLLCLALAAAEESPAPSASRSRTSR